MLEAFGSAFAGIFGAIYDTGTLHRSTRTEAEDGDVSVTWANVVIKGQVYQVSEQMRQAAGYTAKQQRLLVLQDGVSPAITSADEITLGGTRWAIAAVETDPLNTHFVIRGERA